MGQASKCSHANGSRCVWCSVVVQGDAVRCNAWQCVVVCGSVLQCVAVCCVRTGLFGNGSMDMCHELGIKMLSCNRLTVCAVRCGAAMQCAAV